jgi:hypothetical protein
MRPDETREERAYFQQTLPQIFLKKCRQKKPSIEEEEENQTKMNTFVIICNSPLKQTRLESREIERREIPV